MTQLSLGQYLHLLPYTTLVDIYISSVFRVMTRWYSRCCFQTPHQELVDGLKICLMSSLKKYHDVGQGSSRSDEVASRSNIEHQEIYKFSALCFQIISHVSIVDNLQCQNFLHDIGRQVVSSFVQKIKKCKSWNIWWLILEMNGFYIQVTHGKCISQCTLLLLEKFSGLLPCKSKRLGMNCCSFDV